jgi:hypothetical protein
MEDIENYATYLMNFWKPKAGDTIKLNGDGEVYKIESIFPDADSQVLLSNNTIAFLQDCDWLPTMEDCFNIVKSFGVVVTKDSVKLGKTWYPLTQSVQEFPDLIRNIRWNGYVRGDEIMENYFTTEIT